MTENIVLLTIYKGLRGGSLVEVDLICSLNMLNINESLLRLSVTDYDY